MEGDSFNAFSVSDDLIKSFHREVRNSDALGAKLIKEEGKKDVIIIDYEADGLFYQGILEIDLQTFIFQELSFKEIP